MARSGESANDSPARHRGWSPVVLLGAIVVGAALRVFDLAGLPGEMYGDIAIVHEYVAEIESGTWPTHFTLSSGPLYHYLIMPVVWIGGSGFTSLKVASALVSAMVVAVTYLLARELTDRRIAAASAFVAAVSSWLLVFSRLGNSQIVTPLIATGALYLAVRTARADSLRSAVACGVVATAGLYAYPQTFAVAPTVLIALVLLRRNGSGVRRSHIAAFALTSATVALPFLTIFLDDPDNFLSGYIGGKVHSRSGTLGTLATNAWRALSGLHLHGDSVFRSNPRGAPHLDVLSGLLFIVGLVWWFAPARRRWWPVVILPLVLLQLPSMMVLASVGEVPSASRTLLVAPLVYIVTASGLCWLAAAVHRSTSVRRSVAAVLLCLLVVLNGDRYFGAYADGLPNGNVAFGRTIADRFEALDPETHAFMIGCCWGEAGQPEPKGITYLDAGPVATGMIELARDSFDCASLAALPRPAIVVWSPADELPSPSLGPCASLLVREVHSVDGIAVFNSALLEQP